MYNIIDKTRRLSGRIALGAALFAASLLPISCSDDLLYDEDIYMNEDGTFGPFDLAVKIDAEGSDSKTRSGFGTDGFQINNVWLAMFDSDSGQLLAINNNDFTGPIQDNSQVGDHGQAIADRTCKLNSIMFSNKTKTAYIVAVANTKGVMAVDKNGEYWELDSVLNHLQNSVDFKNVIVDNSSAERAMAATGNAPLMSGVWGSQHFNYTMNLGGKVYGNVATPTSGVADEYALITLYDSNLKVACKERVESGMVHLRRLYAHINVNVNFDTDYFTSIEDPSVEVCNMPRYTFLQEHKTVENSEAYDETTPDANGRTWKDATHTGAHLMPGSSLASTGIITPGQVKNFYANPDEATFVMNDAEDKVSFDGKNLKFGYWHYETKHWGLENVKSVNDREKMFDGGKYFTSLCPSTSKTFNNDAPYFVVRAKVKTNDGYQGNAEFVVHEGYCCSPNSNASTDEAVIARDFCTFRNTNYNYTVSIQGINGYKLKVQSEDFSGDGYYGAGGEMWGDGSSTRAMKMPKTGGTYKMTIPGTNSGIKDFYWAMSDDSEVTFWGKAIDASDDVATERFPYFKNLSFNGTQNLNSEFYKGVTITYNGVETDLQGLNALRVAEDKEATIRFDGQNSFNGTLYLCGIYTSADLTAKYYTVFKLTQIGLELAQPQLSMPYAPPTGNVVVGIDPHTIVWDPVEGATSYTITLKETGYSVTLSEKEGTKDSAGFDIPPLTVNSNGKLEFTLRYANSVGGMLKLFNGSKNYMTATGTFEVVANAGSAHSDPATISRTFANPAWDFSGAEFKAAIKSFFGGTQYATFNTNDLFTFNGLSFYAGNLTSNLPKFDNSKSIDHFDFGGTANTSQRHFRFHCFTKKVQFLITTSSNGSKSSGRHVNFGTFSGVGEESVLLYQFAEANTTDSGTPKEFSVKDIITDGKIDFNVPYNQPNVILYPTGNIWMYKIVMTPQD